MKPLNSNQMVVVSFFYLRTAWSIQANQNTRSLTKINREKIVCTILLFNLDLNLNLFINKFSAQLVWNLHTNPVRWCCFYSPGGIYLKMWNIIFLAIFIDTKSILILYTQHISTKQCAQHKCCTSEKCKYIDCKHNKFVAIQIG